MTFVRNIQKTGIDFACFSFHVGLFFQLFVFQTGHVSQSLTVQLFPWLGEQGTVLLEHEKFYAQNMSNVR